MEDRITGRESLRREVLARLARDPVAKHPTGGHDSKQQGCTDRDEKLGNTKNESEGTAAGRLILHNGDVEGRTGRKTKRDEEKK